MPIHFHSSTTSGSARHGHDDLNRVGTENSAYLWHGFDCVQNVDRETAAHENDEAVTATERVLFRQVEKLLVVAGPAH
jgi:hypothetical protein